MIILKDGDNRNDVLGLTNDDLKIIEMGLKGLIKNNKSINPDRVWQLIRGFNNNLTFFDTNIDSISMFRKNENDCANTVDLGLPSGLLWATCNVGATSPEQAGQYFAWGETTGYTAEQVTGGERKFNYNSLKVRNITGNLTAEQDAAHAYMGGKWRMPTKEEFQELMDNCDVNWTDDYIGIGVAGMLLTSKVNGSSIFFPAAGHCGGSSVSCVGLLSHYWSASGNSSGDAWSLYFNDGSSYVLNDRRYFGLSVRGVCER